jgi:hypothetical protein
MKVDLNFIRFAWEKGKKWSQGLIYAQKSFFCQGSNLSIDLVKVSLAKFWKTFWYFLVLIEIHKISQNFTKFHKISQNFTKFHKISQNFTKFHKISQNLMIVNDYFVNFVQYCNFPHLLVLSFNFPPLFDTLNFVKFWMESDGKRQKKSLSQLA